MNVRHTGRLMTIVGIIALVSACVTPPKWEDSVGNEYTDGEAGYAITLPSGWAWIKYNDKAPLLSSHDGPDLQAIRVYFRTPDKAFPAIEEKSSPDMMPRELAELFVADLRKRCQVPRDCLRMYYRPRAVRHHLQRPGAALLREERRPVRAVGTDISLPVLKRVRTSSLFRSAGLRPCPSAR
jgi:hypothetical protein